MADAQGARRTRVDTHRIPGGSGSPPSKDTVKSRLYHTLGTDMVEKIDYDKLAYDGNGHWEVPVTFRFPH